jgi:hypothetical protein
MFPSIQTVRTNLQHHPFFHKLSQYDIKARNMKTIEEYKSYYLNNIREFTDKEKTKLLLLSKEADKRTKTYPKLHFIPWSFVKTGHGIENDYPHTMNNHIMLPFDFLYNHRTETLIETLIHEKIHIFQKLYTLETNILIIQFWNYSIYSLNHSVELKRANPDINDILYKRNHTECIQEYKSNEPTSLRDSSRDVNCKYEHPYEKMAYIIAEIITRQIYTTDDHIQALKWMQKYLKKP